MGVAPVDEEEEEVEGTGEGEETEVGVAEGAARVVGAGEEG